jgi:hypothetical protein
MGQEVGVGSFDAVAVEEPMVLQGGLQIVLGVRASHSWEGERVSNYLRMELSA